MINLPRINITDNKTLLLILFTSIIFYILIYLDVNKIAVMIFIILFFVYYDTVIKNTNKFFFTKKERDENYNNQYNYAKKSLVDSLSNKLPVKEILNLVENLIRLLFIYKLYKSNKVFVITN